MSDWDLTTIVADADRRARAETAKPPKRQAAARPNPRRDHIRETYRAKTQLNLNGVPVAVKELFIAAAADRGFDCPKHYFYHLMRLDGHDIPEPETMDGRRRPKR